MIKRCNEFLSGIPMTGGVFLLISLLLSWQGMIWGFDPAWITVIICGVPLVYLALQRLICNTGIKKISSALLISIAMCAAIAIGDLFAAGEVAFIMALGAIIEEKTTQRAKKGLKKLIRLAPEVGRRIVDGKEEQIAVQDICQGDILRILPGEKFPRTGKLLAAAPR